MTATPACIRLPREIVDFITEDFKDDKKTLSACCFISRSANTWIASCRAHIFRDLTVHVHRRGRNLTKFMQFLESARFVAENVEMLCLRKSGVFVSSYPIDVRILRPLLDKLPRLRYLSLQRLYCSLKKGSEMPHEDSNRKFKLKTLKYRADEVDDGSLPALLQILSLFSEVDELHFQDSPVKAGFFPLKTPMTASSLPTINSLIFEGEVHHILTLSRDVLQIASLRALAIPVELSGRRATEFKKMLVLYGQNLRTLHLVLGDLQDEVLQETWKSMLLDTLTSLESVTFILSTSQHLYSPHFPSLANCVDVLPPAKISQINLICAVPKEYIHTSEKFWEGYTFPQSTSYRYDHSSHFDETCCKLPSLQKVFCGWTVGHVYSPEHPVMVDSDITLWRSWAPHRWLCLEGMLAPLAERGLLYPE
ncbi:hypothetical protein BDW22DRAFT_1345671 [Trametopsis cervina]|nr:hypothetical protein BDW22DRAFT_1345671 [Trametopsis cervina]